ncbi:MAG: type I restriction endonuclease [Syntrophomonadaceae bacterium]|nr:type I restriction endonuclease [Syntrophomonadaceae bacterium]HPR94117.1 type I restriction endonuclease [Syntrophomonadaceae bacterium]
MDYFNERIIEFSARVESLKGQVQTEEATKTALIMPFFQLLGYDIFNPSEFVPEYIADVGIKKGEKIDYAIFINGNLSILLEAKSAAEDLNKHGSQLFRYFATLPARFGILTNGIEYRFYTDLDTPNIMDERPFLAFNLLDIKDALMPEIKKFERNNFNRDNILTSAAELKYTQEIKKELGAEFQTPSDDFIRFLLKDIYSGMKTQNVIDRFRSITQKAIEQFINDTLSDRFKAAMSGKPETEATDDLTSPVDVPTENEKPKIITTLEEVEAFAIVKTILKNVVDPARLFYRDTESYVGILLDDNKLKWICRISIGKVQINLYIPDADKKPLRYALTSINDIYSFEDQLIDSVQRYLI